MCVFFVLSTRRHPAHPVSELTLHPTEIQALWPPNYDTGSYVVWQLRCTRWTAVVVQCHVIVPDYDRHNIHTPATPIRFFFLFHQHFYFPAQLAGSFTLTAIFWTSGGDKCRPFSHLLVRAFIFIAHRRFSLPTGHRRSSNFAINNTQKKE